MTSKLLIVESPAKAKKIKSYLGSEWDVVASLGHVRDLPITGPEAYIKPPDFSIKYVTMKGKEATISALKTKSKGVEVYLATDPDREGEAIAWHLCKVLGLDPKTTPRVTYHEISEKAVKKAIENAAHINMHLVIAQEARRALDRIVGWEVSGPLSRWIGDKASAGRVQSPALRVIVERERAIRNFKANDFITISAIMDGWSMAFDPKMEEGEYFQDKDRAQEILERLNANEVLSVVRASSSTVKKSPSAPFTTSSLQSTASSRFKLDVEEVMKCAQGLYEGGHITYHRTDDPNLGDEGFALVKGYIESKAADGWEAVNSKRTFKAKEGAQEGHECIRPTHMEVESAGDTDTQRKVYDLIRKRTIACQMVDAEYKKNAVQAKDSVGEIFNGSGSVLTKAGWKEVYEEDDDNGDPAVPVLKQGDEVKAERGKIEFKKTKPPSRFSQATLVTELEKNGVGRPSTYASIIKVLFAREYVRSDKQSMIPTPLGEKVLDALDIFSFSHLDYTSGMETELDNIVSGKTNYKDILAILYDDIQTVLTERKEMGGRPKMVCPKDGCEGTITRYESKKKPGMFFWVCDTAEEGDPHRFIADDAGEPVWPPAADNRERRPCPVDSCDGTVVRIKGSNGYFWGCSTKAHSTLRDADGEPQAPTAGSSGSSGEAVDIKCPKCKKALTKRLTNGAQKPYLTCFNKHGPWWMNEDGTVGMEWKKK
jgi:DNA topoisomerase-1